MKIVYRPGLPDSTNVGSYSVGIGSLSRQHLFTPDVESQNSKEVEERWRMPCGSCEEGE